MKIALLDRIVSIEMEFLLYLTDIVPPLHAPIDSAQIV